MRQHPYSAPLSRLLRLAAGLALAALAVSCNTPLPLRVRDDRTTSAELTGVDVYAVPNERERLRAMMTPVDEYYCTQGRPARPKQVWQTNLMPGDSLTLTPGEQPYYSWLGAGAIRLVALTPQPARRHTCTTDPRRAVFSLRRWDYPRGTRSLLLRVTEGGLSILPSKQKIKGPDKPNELDFTCLPPL